MGTNGLLPTTDVAPALGHTGDSFWAHIQHGLRTPINAIIGYSRILLEDSDQYPQWASDIEKIHAAGMELLEVVDRILESRTERSSQQSQGLNLFGPKTRHELKGALNVIVGYTEMLLEDTGGRAPSVFLADLRRILRAAHQLTATVGELSVVSPGRIPELPGMLASTAALAEDAISTLQSLSPQHEPVAAEPASILVVDDHDSNRDLVSRQLEREGYTVDTAENGRQAMEMLRQSAYDLVLLDILMPEMNGYEVLAALKGDGNLSHVPVIVISAFDDLRSVARCIEMGADEYLPKLFNPVLLKARVAASLEKKRLRDRERHYLERIRTEQQKSESLLLNILPRPIAERLKRGESRIADQFSEVTVLFADLVSFTDFASRASASTLVDRLNEVFHAFDRLVGDYGLEKIKTIGDSYMLVGGLPLPRSDHAAAVADAALAMLDTANGINRRHDDPLELRIGVHTGPVIAGVIGQTKFTYDLWGDTVNVASRMESQGIAGCIQVSQSAYEHLRHDFALEERGLVRIKGKGEMVTYLLKGRR